jgi:thiamine kinase-like enzyme
MGPSRVRLRREFPHANSRAMRLPCRRCVSRPQTIIHSDFHTKNLIHGIGGRIVPVDWPGAYVHPHLGGRW